MRFSVYDVGFRVKGSGYLVEEEGEHGKDADDVDKLFVPHLADHRDNDLRVLQKLARAAPRVEDHLV
jgi:hypothetical protein